MTEQEFLFYAWIEAIGLTSIVFGSCWYLLRKFPKFAQSIGLGKEEKLTNLEKLFVEGSKYQRDFLKTIKQEMKEVYSFQALEIIDETRIDEQQVKQGFKAGLLISWGGGSYRWIWRLNDQGEIAEIIGQYQDWFMPFVNVRTTKTQQEQMKRLLKKVEVPT